MNTFAKRQDKLLFTPGPLTTSRAVKQAMLSDLGTWDREFNDLVREIRTHLLQIANVDADEFTVIPMQGSGTFGLESVLASIVPEDGKVLVLINGAYGKRIAMMSEMMGLTTLKIEYPENTTVNPVDLDRFLKQNNDISLVVVVHCETTSGIMNPIAPLGEIAAKYSVSYAVDAMSSFGAVPIEFDKSHIDFLVSSPNKCLESVPGFSFIFANLEKLHSSKGNARSLSMDLLGQWEGFEKNHKFRYTPPTHVIAAFAQALQEFEEEGGLPARAKRYQDNHRVLVNGMRCMGFHEYIEPSLQSYIITAFMYPEHPNFDFCEFYNRLHDRNYIIYPGKISSEDCFRIGNIGRIFPSDIKNLLAAINEVLTEMAIELLPEASLLDFRHESIG